MPKTTNRLYHLFAVTRGEIQEASKTLENQIFFETSKNVYISRIEQIDSAQNEGDRISTEYERLLSRWSEIPTKNKIKEHANTHYDYAVHLASLRMYYHFLSEQTESPTEKEHFLVKALEKSTLSLQQMDKAYLLYTEQNDKNVTLHYNKDYTLRHDMIHSELQKLNQLRPNISAKNSNPQRTESNTLMKKRKISVEIPNEDTVDNTTPYTPTLDNLISMFLDPDKKKSYSSTNSTTSTNLNNFSNLMTPSTAGSLSGSDSSLTDVYCNPVSLKDFPTFLLFGGNNNENAQPSVTTPFSVLKKKSRTTTDTKKSSASTSDTETDFLQTTMPSTR